MRNLPKYRIRRNKNFSDAQIAVHDKTVGFPETIQPKVGNHVTAGCSTGKAMKIIFSTASGALVVGGVSDTYIYISKPSKPSRR